MYGPLMESWESPKVILEPPMESWGSKWKFEGLQWKLRLSNGKLRVSNGKLRVSNSKLRFSNGKSRVPNGKLKACNGKSRVPNGKLRVYNGKFRFQMENWGSPSPKSDERWTPKALNDKVCLIQRFSNIINIFRKIFGLLQQFKR